MLTDSKVLNIPPVTLPTLSVIILITPIYPPINGIAIIVTVNIRAVKADNSKNLGNPRDQLFYLQEHDST